MTRRFYTDPLEAAWMAKHFGMRFEILKPRLPIDADVREVPYCSGGFIGVTTWDGDKMLGSRPHHPDEVLYIHPDSLCLLEPQTGDIGEEGGFTFKYGGFIGGWNNGNWDKPVYPDRAAAVRIIQRNGLAFHWPESEAA
jgi:hypothetical protein